MKPPIAHGVRARLVATQRGQPEKELGAARAPGFRRPSPSRREWI